MNPTVATKPAIVIPAYQEAATIRDIVQRCLAHGEPVIVVDDGSSDDTAAQVADLPVTLIRHPHNRGKAHSLWTGMQAALSMGADAVITLDGDGQHAPEDIARLIAARAQAPDALIIGARLLNRAEAPAARRRANDFADFWISWASGQRILDSQSGFRLYPGTLLRDLEIRRSDRYGFVFESEILIEAVRRGVAVRSVGMASRYPPQARRSHFRPVLDIAAIVLMVAGKLLARALHPLGLYRALFGADPRITLSANADPADRRN